MGLPFLYFVDDNTYHYQLLGELCKTNVFKDFSSMLFLIGSLITLPSLIVRGVY